MTTKKHLMKAAENKLDQETHVKNMSANVKAGMIVGTFVYNIIKKRRAMRELEDDLFLLQKFGLYIGNINHSYTLVSSLRPYFAAEIRSRKKGFFSTHMDPTAFLPTLNMTSDGATNGRRGRSFHGANMIIPATQEHSTAQCVNDSPIQSLSLGVTLMPKGKTGPLLVEDMLQR